MVRAAALICAALSAEADADFLSRLGFQSYSVGWTSVSHSSGQTVQETHGFSRSGEATKEIRSTITQDAFGAVHGAKDEVRCVGEHCAERLTVVAPAGEKVQLRGAEAPCHKKHMVAMKQAAQAAAADGGVPALRPGQPLGVPEGGVPAMRSGQMLAGVVTDGGVPAMRPGQPLGATQGMPEGGVPAEPMSNGLTAAQLAQFFAACVFAGSALGACLSVALMRGRKTRVQMQNVRQLLLPSAWQGGAARAPTAQDDLRRALHDLGNTAVESYVFGLYARGAYKAEIAQTDAEARAYVRELCGRACLA